MYISNGRTYSKLRPLQEIACQTVLDTDASNGEGDSIQHKKTRKDLWWPYGAHAAQVTRLSISCCYHEPPDVYCSIKASDHPTVFRPYVHNKMYHREAKEYGAAAFH
jgi:hypothetical protein